MQGLTLDLGRRRVRVLALANLEIITGLYRAPRR